MRARTFLLHVKLLRAGIFGAVAFFRVSPTWSAPSEQGTTEQAVEFKIVVNGPENGCISPDELRNEITALRSDDPWPENMAVLVEEHDNLSVTITYLERKVPKATRTLVGGKEACAQLIEATAWLVAAGLEELSLNADAEGAVRKDGAVLQDGAVSPHPTEKAEPSAQPKASPAPARDQKSQARNSDFQIAAIASVGASWILPGSVPTPLFDVRLVPRWRLARDWDLAIQTGVLFTWMTDRLVGDPPGTHVDASLLAGRVDVCLSARVRLGACLGVAGGVVSGRGNDLEESRAGKAPWFAAALGAGWRTPSFGPFFGTFGAEAQLVFVRPRFVILEDGGQVAEDVTFPGFSGQFTAGAGYSF